MRNLPDLSDLAKTGGEIHVRATPGAARNTIVQTDYGLNVRITAKAEDGKANAAVQKLLAKALGVAKTRLSLIRGATARNKVFRLD